jgi:hypothetical protein
MQIQYVANRSRRNVRDSVGRELVGRGIAREMRSEEPSQDEQTQGPAVQSAAKPAKAPEDPNISPRTGKPKREYKRRDMRPEA